MFDEEAEAKLRALHRQLRELEEKRKEIIGQIERLGLGTGAKALKVADATAPAPTRPGQAAIPGLFEPCGMPPRATGRQSPEIPRGFPSQAVAPVTVSVGWQLS
jgi:hypothetical protein